MSTVILAEKPSQALAMRGALKAKHQKDGYFGGSRETHYLQR